MFRLNEKGLELIEIAPGIEIVRDIINQMDFKPLITKTLLKMNAKIFFDEKIK